MKINILLLSRKSEHAEIIQQQLSKHGDFNVFQETSAKGAVERLSSTKTIRAVVVNCENFGFEQLLMVNQIRELGFGFKILVLATKIQDRARNLVDRISNVSIFGKSYVDLELDSVGLLKRALANEKVVNRSNKRHAARQMGMFKKDKTRELANCTICNLSKTGAYIEFEKGHFNIGDRIQVIVPLSEIGKTHIINSKITWLQVSKTGQKSAGLRFLK